MNRTLLLSLLASTAVGGVATVMLANPPVELQPGSPGVAQTGNVNVTGKVLSGKLEANDSSATGIAIVGNALHASGANYGGLFKTLSSAGTGIRGVSTATTGNANGGTFQSASPAGAGIRGFATSATGVNYGVYGKAVSPEGFAGFFVGRTSTSGDALFSKIGMGTVPSPLELRFHIKDDILAAPRGLGYIVNGTPASLPGTGRRGLTVQSGGTGDYVIGVSGYANGNLGSTAYGFFGIANGLGTNYGVFGDAYGGATNYSGYFNGALYASSASSGVKTFMIDHPLDPENKVLTHSSVESDERLNLYRGEIVTDANGNATITVPAWFDALNTDIQYQLTVINEGGTAFIQAMVVQRLKNGKFKVKTSSPGATVNWQVSGRRHDPTSNHYPLEVERMKNDGERGKYYEPEAYGKDKSLGMAHMESEVATKPKPKT